MKRGEGCTGKNVLEMEVQYMEQEAEEDQDQG